MDTPEVIEKKMMSFWRQARWEIMTSHRRKLIEQVCHRTKKGTKSPLMKPNLNATSYTGHTHKY